MTKSRLAKSVPSPRWTAAAVWLLLYGGGPAAASAAAPPADPPSWTMVREGPIAQWDEALPLGNGLLGALVWGAFLGYVGVFGRRAARAGETGDLAADLLADTAPTAA